MSEARSSRRRARRARCGRVRAGRPRAARIAATRSRRTRPRKRSSSASVAAEGNLQAVKATPILTPQNSGSRPDEDRVARARRHRRQAARRRRQVRSERLREAAARRRGRSRVGERAARRKNIKSHTAVADSETDADLAGDELEQTRRFQAKDAEIFSRNQIIESEVDANLAGAKQDPRAAGRGRSRSGARNRTPR